MTQRLRSQHGLALVSVLTLTFVLMVLSALILDLSSKEMKMTAVRRVGAQSLYLAEGGAVSARAALMAFMSADPLLATTIDPTLSGTAQAGWYAGGIATNQNTFGIIDYLVLDGQRFTLGATSTTPSVTFQVNWSLPTTHLKLQTGSSVTSPLGSGTYTATVVLTRKQTAHSSCVGGPCSVHSLGNDMYEYFYTYTITSNGNVGQGRRRVILAADYSILVRRQNFSRFALFTNVHLTPSNGAIWFTNRTTFDGPVHTNGEFRFAFFPQFGTPDPSAPPCSTSRIASTPVESVSTNAWFNNNGSPVELAANENVSGGTRIDAPVMPGCAATANNNDPANFTRGVAVVAMPSNFFSQEGVSIGRDPADTSTVTNLQIRNAIPELQPKNNAGIPAGIYVPVVDTNNNGSSDPGKPMGGGIYVQGNLDSFTLSYSGSNAVYTLVQNTQTVTITVDRVLQQTTVTNTAWSTPQTRTFTGVPKGFQGPGNANAIIAYTEGNINSLSGTLGQNEQMTIVANGSINITNNLVYQQPPVVTDPNSNPLNVLGLYSASRDITIDPSAPNDVQIHAVLMAGNMGNTYNSSVNVTNYNVGAPRGQVHLIGGIIEKYYGAFGTFNSSTGAIQTGYGRDIKYDRRMNRGFTPPYFPTINLYEVVQGSLALAGVQPTWREGAP